MCKVVAFLTILCTCTWCVDWGTSYNYFGKKRTSHCVTAWPHDVDKQHSNDTPSTEYGTSSSWEHQHWFEIVVVYTYIPCTQYSRDYGPRSQVPGVYTRWYHRVAVRKLYLVPCERSCTLIQMYIGLGLYQIYQNSTNTCCILWCRLGKQVVHKIN